MGQSWAVRVTLYDYKGAECLHLRVLCGNLN